MSFGEIVLPDSIVTVGEARSTADIVHLAASYLKRDMAQVHARLIATQDGRNLVNDYARFYEDWRNFYYVDPITGIIRYITLSYVPLLRSYVAQFNSFEQRFRDLGFTPTQAPQPADTGWEVPTIVYVVLGVTALGLSAYMFGPALREGGPVFVRAASERFRTQTAGLRGKRLAG